MNTKSWNVKTAANKTWDGQECERCGVAPINMDDKAVRNGHQVRSGDKNIKIESLNSDANPSILISIVRTWAYMFHGIDMFVLDDTDYFIFVFCVEHFLANIEGESHQGSSAFESSWCGVRQVN